jgi:stearoyl-CoA desaturase (delta-9 desaturase)
MQSASEVFPGLVHLPWWGYVVVALALTHVTIASVTIFLHRTQAHRALALHPAASHFFRAWLWLTTGMVTKEWAAVHRKHHAKCETAEDPHSPQVYGINRVLWGGVFLYVKAAHEADTLERYGHGTPDDWIERHVYTPLALYGVTLTFVVDLLLFGAGPGALIWIAQMIWIPFWAAGVVNGIGHYWGYRNWPAPDASTNIFPVGVIIGGEELHNNHHAFPTSARLSSKWYEFDIGWLYIRILQAFGLATIRHVAPTPRFTSPRAAVDAEALQAIIRCRYDVLAKYAKSLRRIYAEEVRRLRRLSPCDAFELRAVRPWLNRDGHFLREHERLHLAMILPKARGLETMYVMRQELTAIWGLSSASIEQMIGRLQDWCHRAESSGIKPLVEFSQRLRSYA